jgi:hypothetical protein
MGHADGDAVTNTAVLFGKARLGASLKGSHFIPTTLSQLHKFSKGQYITPLPDYINQIYICKTKICL